MSMKSSLFSSVILALLASPSLLLAEKATRPPNVIIIFADDMGYGDMSGNGHPSIRTPHLDEMAAEGQKWTNFYAAAPVCTPSRAALLTGRYPIRNGMCSNTRPVFNTNAISGLPPSEITLAEMLKTRGYTTGMVGKWHLGHLPEYLPTKQGFDSWFGIPYSNDMDMDRQLIREANRDSRKLPWVEHWENPRSAYWNIPLMEGDTILERAPNQDLLTKTFTEKSISFIEANKERPFFLYLAHSMPHVPLFRSDAFKGVSTGGLYGDVIEELDASVGQILKTLKDLALADNTLVVFTSDNGPWLRYKTLGGISGPLRDGKGTTWEGGMRVPTIFWSPGGMVKPALIHGLGTTMDLMATLATLCSADLPEVSLDSHDLSKTLFTGAPSPRKDFFYYRGEELIAVRYKSYKLHFKISGEKSHENITLKQPLLYNLDHDPGENYDVFDDHPEVVATLTRLSEAHLKTIVPVENQLNKVSTKTTP